MEKQQKDIFEIYKKPRVEEYFFFIISSTHHHMADSLVIFDSYDEIRQNITELKLCAKESNDIEFIFNQILVRREVDYHENGDAQLDIPHHYHCIPCTISEANEIIRTIINAEIIDSFTLKPTPFQRY